MLRNTMVPACVLAAFSTFFTSGLLAQQHNGPSVGNYYYPSPDFNPDGTPKVLKLCSVSKDKPNQKSCELWTFTAGHYNAAHPQNPPAILVMDKLTKENVVLRLMNPGVPGFSGTIKAMVGQLSADGYSTSSGISMTRDGKTDSFEAYWGSALQSGAATSIKVPTTQASARPKPVVADAAKFDPSAPVPIPQVMHFCAAHCLTFTLEKDGKLHNYTNLAAQFNEHRVLDIQKFTFNSVIIERTDTGSNPGHGSMHGNMQFGSSNAVSNEGWSLSWGDALNLLPGLHQSPTPLHQSHSS